MLGKQIHLLNLQFYRDLYTRIVLSMCEYHDKWLTYCLNVSWSGWVAASGPLWNTESDWWNYDISDAPWLPAGQKCVFSWRWTCRLLSSWLRGRVVLQVFALRCTRYEWDYTVSQPTSPEPKIMKSLRPQSHYRINLQREVIRESRTL